MDRERMIASITYALPELTDAGLLAVEGYIGTLQRRELTSESLAREQFERDKLFEMRRVAERANDHRDMIGGK